MSFALKAVFYRCPKDSNIFPPMELDANTKSLFAEFKAFRFPTSATVNFIATIAFCQERCEPVSDRRQIGRLSSRKSALCPGALP